jgi:hypothetical protein
MITKNEAEIIQSIATALAADNPDFISEISDLACELQDTFGIKASSGCYRTAFILDNVVVKVSKNKARANDLVSEANFIQKMKKDKKFGRHFPKTEVFKVGNVTLQIQEKVDMSHKGMSFVVRGQVSDLADKLGIEDCHEGNYGWKTGKNGKYPVFVDVDFRNEPSVKRKKKNRRSWFV